MSSASPLKRSIRMPLSSPKHFYSPSKYDKRRSHSRSALYEDVLAGPFIATDAQITKSKRRIEKLAKAHLPESEAVDELKRQLLTKDQFIEALKDRFTELRVETKYTEGESIHSKERVIQQLCRDKIDLAKTVQSLEMENQQLKLHAQRQPEESPTRVELVRDGETLREDIVGLKAQLQAKETLLANMKKDLSQLSEIIYGMTTLNTELNEKVIKQNLDMEDTNRNAYQAMAKAQHIDEIEKALIEVTTEKQKLESQLQKMRVNEGKMMDMEEAAAELRSWIASIALSDEYLSQITAILARFHPESVRKLPEAVVLKAKIKELEGELRTISRELTKSKANEVTFKARILSFEEEHKVWKREMDSSFEQLHKTVSLLQVGVKDLSGRYDKITEEYQRTKSEVQRTSFRLSLLQGKLDKATSAASQASKAEQRTTAQLKDAHSQLTALKSTKSSLEASLLLRDQKSKEDAARLKVLSEEIWKRDTQILKKSGDMFKLQEQMSSQKMGLNHSFSKPGKALGRVSPLRQYESRSFSVAYPLKPFVKPAKNNNRTAQSRSLVFARSPIEAPPHDRPLFLLETLGRALELSGLVNSGGSPAPSSLRSLLGNKAKEGSVADALVEKMWSLVNELEDLVQNGEGVTVAGMRERTKVALGLIEKQVYYPADLLASVKAAIREAEHNTLE